MESCQSHYDRSLCDEATANELCAKMSGNGWEIVIRFYSALHLTQAYMVTKNIRFEASRHNERWQAINASPELTKGKRFPMAYGMLQSVSEQVRYDPGFIARPKHFQDARDNLRTVQSFLNAKVTKYLPAKYS